MMYLAVTDGTTTIDLTSGAVKVQGPVQFPAPSSRFASAQIAGIRTPLSDDYATRAIPVEIHAATAALAEDELIALKRVCETYRSRLVYRSDTGPEIWTTIRYAQVSEPSTDWLDRNKGIIEATVTLTTDAEWTGAPVAFSTDEITVAEGDRPARMLLKLTSSAANVLIGVGVKHEPAIGYDPTDVIASPAAVNLTAAYAALHTAEVIDTNSNRGEHAVIAKVATNAVAAASTRYRAVSEVTGSGVAESTEAEGRSTEALGTTARLTLIPGLVSVPAGGVPGMTTGSGYAAEAISAEQTTENADQLADRDGNSANGGGCGQTVALTAGEKVTGVTFKTGATGTTAGATLSVYAVDGSDLPTGSALVAATFGAVAATTEKHVDLDWTVPASANYAFVVTQAAPAFYLRKNTAGGYASGQAVIADTPSGAWGAVTGHDLYFKVYTQAPLGFDSTVTIQANCSESSKTATLSQVWRLPVDDFCAVWARAFSANQGVLMDAVDPLSEPQTYITTSTAGTAGPTIAPVLMHGEARLRPGVNKLVIAAEGTVTVSGEYHPCYSNAAAGSS